MEDREFTSGICIDKITIRMNGAFTFLSKAFFLDIEVSLRLPERVFVNSRFTSTIQAKEKRLNRKVRIHRWCLGT